MSKVEIILFAVLVVVLIVAIAYFKLAIYFNMYLIKGSGDVLYKSKEVLVWGDKVKLFKPVTDTIRTKEPGFVKEDWCLWANHKARKLSFAEAWARSHAKDKGLLISQQ